MKAIDTHALYRMTTADWQAHALARYNGVNLKFRIMRNTCAEPHVHPDWPEAFFVLSGTVTIDLGTDSVSLAPGEFFEVPAGVRHRSCVSGEATVLVLDQDQALDDPSHHR